MQFELGASKFASACFQLAPTQSNPPKKAGFRWAVRLTRGDANLLRVRGVSGSEWSVLGCAVEHYIFNSKGT